MAEAEGSGRKPIWKRGWFIVLAIIVAASIGASMSGDKEETASPRPGSSKTPPAADEPGVGDPVRDGQFEFTVQRVKCGAKRVGGQFGEDAQGKFCFVYMTVKNIGDQSQAFSGDEQLMFDEEGREFSADTEAQFYLDDGNAIYEEINPGNKVEGIVVFDIPKDARPARLELHDSIFSGGVDVLI